MSKQKSPAELANRKEIRAAQARARRHAQGATPRENSKSAQLRELGVSADAFYARRRRERLRSENESRSRDTVASPDDGDTSPRVEPAPVHETELRDTVASYLDGDTSPADSGSWPVFPEPVLAEPDAEPTFIPYEQGPPPDDGRLWLNTDMFERGWRALPSIGPAPAAEPPIDASPGRADRLIAAVAGFPGGQDPDHQDVLRRLVEAAAARELAR